MSETTQATLPSLQKLKILKEDYEVRSVKIKMDKKTEKFKPEIVLRNKIVKCDENFTDCSNFISDEFMVAVLSLNGHFAIHLDRLEEDDFSSVKWDDEKFKARGFSLSGAEGELRVSLKGHVISKRCGAIIENANNIMLNQAVSEDDEKVPYEHLDHLVKLITLIQEKALAYCFDKEYWKDPQLSMDLPDAPTKAQVLEPESASKGTIENVVADIVAETNAGKPQPQSADKPDGRTPRKRIAKK